MYILFLPHKSYRTTYLTHLLNGKKLKKLFYKNCFYKKRVNKKAI